MYQQDTWCTVDDVMSDLRMPRGRRGGRGGGAVGGRIDKNFIVVGEGPPPTLLETEETEEQYINNGSNLDILPPDLRLIKQMLHMVKDDNIVPVDKLADQTEELVISKLTALAPQPNPHQPIVEVKKEKPCRNVALKSLLLKLDKNKVSLQDIENRKLLTPMDIAEKSSPPAVTSEQSTVSNNNERSSSGSSTPSKQLILLSPKKMFRRKIKKHSPESVKCDAITSPTVPSPPTFVPSAYAREKYNEFMERNNQKAKQATINNNNLEMAYNVMKQIDAISIKPDINKHPGLSEEEFKTLHQILLYSHRHQMQEDCNVCVIKSEMETKYDTNLQIKPKNLQN